MPAGVSITKTGNSATSAQQTKAETTAEAKANPAVAASTLAELKTRYHSIETQQTELAAELGSLNRSKANGAIVPDSTIIRLQDQLLALITEQNAIVAKVESNGGSVADLF